MNGMRTSMSVSPPGSRRMSLASRSKERVQSSAASVRAFHDPLLHDHPQVVPPVSEWPEYAALLRRESVPSVLEGWSTLAKVVHKLDLQKIQGHKEDLDNLLVFAGLFSAVMTAFLIKSFKDLRQNPKDSAVHFLENIALQSNAYSRNANFVNSTLLPQYRSLPPFSASTNSILVNVLWFASLTITLATASYGLLVKQWLREYLADDYTSPQVQLRIREFRNPKLHQWKVFEIASLLPLLLQLSLALFLVGLCFFTAEQHQSVGHTTLPLVAGWGFFFIAATFLPAISRGCPYKTSFVRYNESSEADDEEGDVQMLAKLDSTQSDEILLRTMWTALQQTGHSPDKLLLFIKKIIVNRMQSNGAHIRSTASAQPTESTLSFPIFDLRRLPQRSATSILLMAAELLGNELRKPLLNTSGSNPWQPWMNDCICILFAKWQEGIPVPDPVNSTFALILVDSTLSSSLLAALKSATKDKTPRFLDVFKLLQGALLSIRGDNMLHVLDELARHYFCLGFDAGLSHDTHTLTDIVGDQKAHPDFSAEARQYLAIFLMQSLRIRLFKQKEYPGQSLHAMNHLALLLHLYQPSAASPYDLCPSHIIPSALSRKSLIKLVRTLLSSCRSIYLYFAIAAGAYYHDSPKDELEPEEELVQRVRLVKSLAGELFVNTIVESERADRLIILQKLKRLLEDQLRDSVLQDDWEYLLTDPLEVSDLLLKALQELRDGFIGNIRKETRRILQVVAANLNTRLPSNSSAHEAIATRCLEAINTLDTALKPPPVDQNQSKMEEWANGFQEAKSCFPDPFIDALMSCFPRGHDLNFSNRILCRSIRWKSDTTGHKRARSTGDMTVILPFNVGTDHHQQVASQPLRIRGRSPGPSSSPSIQQQLTQQSQRRSSRSTAGKGAGSNRVRA